MARCYFDHIKPCYSSFIPHIFVIIWQSVISIFRIRSSVPVESTYILQIIQHHFCFQEAHIPFFIVSETMVEDTLLRTRTCPVWYMGWCFHLMPHKHFWSCLISSHRMDGGTNSLFVYHT